MIIKITCCFLICIFIYSNNVTKTIPLLNKILIIYILFNYSQINKSNRHLSVLYTNIFQHFHFKAWLCFTLKYKNWVDDFKINNPFVSNNNNNGRINKINLLLYTFVLGTNNKPVEMSINR